MEMMVLNDADQKALEAAYREFGARLFAWLNYRVSNEEVARDLLHDVFHKAITTAARDAFPNNPFAWLKSVARTTLIDYYRRARPSDPLPGELLDSGEGQESASERVSQCLRPLIEELPHKYREVLLATQLGDQTMVAYAKKEGVSVSAIKSRAARGRQKLGAELLNCCDIELSRHGGIEDYRQRKGRFCSC
ncbi:MAG: sigma-70 family RNA polymerase sigma factor [Thiotrichales bacterium]